MRLLSNASSLGKEDPIGVGKMPIKESSLVGARAGFVTRTVHRGASECWQEAVSRLEWLARRQLDYTLSFYVYVL